ncbi:MAG TPA: site-2 protease family protein [Gemmatimonadales bacterium]|jgi:Zn-dependent protease|nr:site-2 protease family protein [Gemmatimonadales bacterium]
MFGKRLKLFRLLGFNVYIDLSWLFIAVLVSWSLARGVFPARYGGLSLTTYWVMGLAGALGLFASIVFHEFAHSVVARREGTPMRGITLFIFGGVAEMGDEPRSPRSEFLIAIAGPLSSVVLGGMFLGLAALGGGAFPGPLEGVLRYLGWINLVLVAFNVVPAFPLDGGRVLRSALWAWKHDLRRATRIASTIGAGFGLLLMALGIFSFVSGNFIGGMWWFLIGMFVRNASQMSYQQLLLRQTLSGEPVRRFMQPAPITVSPDISVEELVDDYVYKYHHKMFPVVEQDHLKGCVNLEQVKQVARDEWPRHTVREITAGCSPENVVSPDTDAAQALSTMSRKQTSRLMVVDHDRLVGILSLKDLLQFLSLRIELEGA